MGQLDESQIKDLIYEVCGQKVMLDFDLARIYGYEIRYFNRQVKNNTDRFDNDFTFQLTREEWAEILKCKNFTSNWGRQFLSKKELSDSLLFCICDVFLSHEKHYEQFEIFFSDGYGCCFIKLWFLHLV